MEVRGSTGRRCKLCNALDTYLALVAMSYVIKIYILATASIASEMLLK